MNNPSQKKRFRDYGFIVGFLPPGSQNSITDVANVRVGHLTKIEGPDVRTGITVIDPGLDGLFFKKLPAAIHVANGFGKLAGYTQVMELGTIESLLALTNTLAVGPVTRGLIDIVIAANPSLPKTSTINVVVGETNDGFLNDVHKDALTKSDILEAYKNLSNNCSEGNVGAGTGTRAFSWKGGIGTASRVIAAANINYKIGALVQTNYGGALTIMGLPVGRLLGKIDFHIYPETGDGSCMIILATDAPLTARQLGRVARRTILGLARTGSVLTNGSGDYAIAFSTNREGLEGSGAIGQCLPDDQLTQFFLGAVESTEEAVYNALFAAETMHGRDGNTLEALPIAKVVALLEQFKSNIADAGIKN